MTKKMVAIIFIAFLTTAFIFAGGKKEDNSFLDKNQEQIVTVNENKVSLYESPYSDSTVIKKLKKGEKLFCSGYLSATYAVDDIIYNFYKVETADNAVGWVIGKYISGKVVKEGEKYEFVEKVDHTKGVLEKELLYFQAKAPDGKIVKFGTNSNPVLLKEIFGEGEFIAKVPRNYDPTPRIKYFDRYVWEDLMVYIKKYQFTAFSGTEELKAVDTEYEKIYEIYSYRKDIETVSGIKLGATRDEIIKKYGTPYVTIDNNNNIDYASSLYNYYLNFFFSFDNENKLYHMALGLFED